MERVRAKRMAEGSVRQLPVDDAAYLSAAYQAFLAAPRSIRQSATLTAEIALSESELAAIADVGLKPGGATARKAERARQNTLRAFFELATQGSLSTQEAAKRLRVAPSRIRQRIGAGEILAFQVNGEHHIPAVQFEGAAAVPGLAAVLRALPSEMSALAFVRWFTLPCGELEDTSGHALSPRDWLLATGDVAAAVRAARLA